VAHARAPVTVEHIPAVVFHPPRPVSLVPQELPPGSRRAPRGLSEGRLCRSWSHSGFRVSGSGVSGLGFRISGFGFRVPGFGFRISGSGFRVSGLGFRFPGFGFRVSGSARVGAASPRRDSALDSVAVPQPVQPPARIVVPDFGSVLALRTKSQY